MAAVGVVKSIIGQAMVVNERGERHILQVGEKLQAGEHVVTGPGATVSVQLANGKMMDLAAAQTIKVTQNLANADVPDAGENAVNQATIQSVIQAVAEGRDINEVLSAPAAGVNGGASSDGDASFVNLERIRFADPNPNQYAYGTGRDSNRVDLDNRGNDDGRNLRSLSLTAQLDPNSDSGVKGDGITNDNTPTIIGTGNPGATITVVTPNETLTTTVGTDGTWTVTPTSPIPDGPQVIKVTETVPGNPNTVTTDVPVTIDTTGPDLTAKLDPNSDSGVKGDNITNDNTPTIIGTGEPGAKIEVTMPVTGEKLTTTVAPDGTWSVTPTQPIPDGTTGQAHVVETDKAGNPSTKDVPLIIDTGLPNGGVSPTVEITTDANNDGFINKAEQGAATTDAVKVSFDGTKVNVGDVVHVTDGTTTKDITIDATAKTNGYVTTSFDKPVEGGTIKVDAFITDTAGNQSTTGTDKAKLDTSALQGVTITLTTDTNNDGFINKAELNGSSTVNADVTLPKDAAAGDLLLVTGTGNADQAITLTQAQITAGHVAVTFTAPANGVDLKVSAQVTDPAGNQSNVSTDHAFISTQALDAPTVTITTDVNNDGYINKAEQGNSPTDAVRIDLPAGAKAGDTLTVSDGVNPPQTHLLTAGDITAGHYDTTVAKPAEGATLTVTATITDAAGNIGAPGTDSAKLDTSSLLGLGISITTDGNNDGYISKAELTGNTIDAQVTLPKDAVVGDTVTVSGSGNVDQVIVLKAADITNGYLNVSFNPTLDGTDFVAKASIKDAAGNSAGPVQDQAHLQLTAPGAPIVTIDTDGNNDGYLNKTELNGSPTVQVTVTLPATAAVGDQLLVSVNGGTPTPITLTQTDISKGSVSVPNVATPADGATLTVTAQIKDVAGNLGQTGTDNAKVDTTGPDLTAKLDPNSDSGVKGDNITNDNTPTIIGTGEPGAKIEVTMPVTGEKLTTTVAPDGTWSVTPTQPIPDGTTGQAHVVETDKAGNPSTKDVPLIIDTGLPNGGVSPTVEITTDANNDGFINKAEQGAATTDAVKVSFDGTKVNVGDVVHVTDGTTTKDITIDATAKTNGYVTTSFDKPVEGGTIKVDAFITDTAGNQSTTGTDKAKLDTSALQGVTITLTTDTNNDGFINKAELNGSSTVNADVTLPKDAAAGDLLLVTGTGNADQAITLTQAQITAGHVAVTFTAPANGVDLKVSAQVTDPAGNQSNVSTDHAFISTQALDAPTVTITTDVNNDGYINKAEQGNSPTDAVRIDLPAGAKAGDTLTVSDGVNPPQTHLLTAGDITAGHYDTTVAKPAEGATLTVTATITDAAGNIGAPGTDSAKLDTSSLLGLGISITTDGNNDGYISKAELTGNTIDAQVTLPKDAVVGDTVTVSGSGNVDQVIVLKAADITNGYLNVSFNPTLDGTDFVAKASIKDAAGNSAGPVQDQAHLQLTAPGAPIVTIDTDGNNDGYLNKTELNGSPTVQVTVTLPATAAVGDQLLVSVNGGTPTPITLTQTDISKGSVSVPNVATPADGATLTVTAQIKDVAGNLGQTGTDNAKVDTTGPDLTAKLDPNSDSGVKGDNITNDNTPTIIGTGEPGAKIEVTMPVTGEKLTTTVAPDGTWSVTPTQPIPDGTTGQAHVVETDKAGNPSTKDVPLIIDTGLPNGGVSPTVEITTDANNDGFINKAEQGAATTDAVKVSFDGTKVNVGDVVHVTDGTTTKDITIDATAKTNGYVTTSFDKPVEGGTIKVDAFITDTAGNQSTTGTDKAKLDTKTVNPVITSVIDDFGPDKATLPSGSIADDATPTLKGTAEANSTVSILEGGKVIGTALVDGQGNWTFTPSTPINLGLHQYTAIAKDVAGNISDPSNQFNYTLNQAPVFQNQNVTGTISEEALPGGNLGSDGKPSNTDTTTLVGNMGISDPNGDLKAVTLTAPTTAYTSHGTAITWTGSDTNTLIGSANGQEIVRVTIDNTGAYTVKLSGSIDHPVANASDSVAIKFGVNATDASATTVGSIAVTVEDDVPVAKNIVVALPDANPGTNLMFTLDVSGSMTTTDGVNGTTRLASEITSISNLIDKYAALGDTRIMIVSFSDGSNQLSSSWMTVSQAKAALATLKAGGGTNYDAAVAGTESAFNATGKLVGAQNVGYFFSDGEPSTGKEISGADIPAWEQFLKTNHVNEFAIGVGSGVTDQSVANSLNQLAYNGATATDTNAVHVTQLGQLDSVLAATVPKSVTGTLAQGGGFGADGGFVKSLVIEGTTYNFDAKSGALTVAGTNNSTYNANTHELTVKTASGSFLVDMDNGNYTLTPATVTTTLVNTTFDANANGQNTSLPAGWFTDNPSGKVEINPSTLYGLSSTYGNVLEIENYRGDGNLYTLVTPGQNDTVTLSFDYAARANTNAGTDSAIQVIVDGKVIDTVNTHSLDMTHFSYSVIGTGSQMRIEFKSIDTNSTGGLLDNIQVTTATTTTPAGKTDIGYTLSDNDGDTASATMTLSHGSDTIYGSNADDILISGAGNHTLYGGAGNDTLIAGDGNDTLYGGSGNNTLTGGLGANVFKFVLGDQGSAGTPTVNTITDAGVGNNVLDVRDLLQGENSNNLQNYLHFEKSGNDTIVHISNTGGFASDSHAASGAYSSGQETMKVVLSGVDLTAGQSSDAQIIANMLAQQKLITDH